MSDIKEMQAKLKALKAELGEVEVMMVELGTLKADLAELKQQHDTSAQPPEPQQQVESLKGALADAVQRCGYGDAEILRLRAEAQEKDNE
jgi:hypothetical protein